MLFFARESSLLFYIWLIFTPIIIIIAAILSTKMVQCVLGAVVCSVVESLILCFTVLVMGPSIGLSGSLVYGGALIALVLPIDLVATVIPQMGMYGIVYSFRALGNVEVVDEEKTNESSSEGK